MISPTSIARIGILTLMIGTCLTPSAHSAGSGSGSGSASTGGSANTNSAANSGSTMSGTSANTGTDSVAASNRTGSRSWDTENTYWQSNFNSRPYYNRNMNYSTYEPAYRYGYESYSQYNGRPFEEVEPQLRSSWSNSRGNSNLEWNQARDAVRDSYTRMGGSMTSSGSNASNQ